MPPQDIGEENNGSPSTQVIRARGRWWPAAACATVLVVSTASEIWIDHVATATLRSEKAASQIKQWEAGLHALLQPLVSGSAALATIHQAQSLESLRRERPVLAAQVSILSRSTTMDEQWSVVALDGELLAGSGLPVSDPVQARDQTLLVSDAGGRTPDRPAFETSAGDPDRLNISTPLRLADGSVVGTIRVTVPTQELQELARRLLGSEAWVLFFDTRGTFFQYTGARPESGAQHAGALKMLARSPRTRDSLTLQSLATDDGSRLHWIASTDHAAYGFTTTVAIVADTTPISPGSQWLLKGLQVAALLALLVLALRSLARARQLLSQATRRIDRTRRAYLHLLNQMPQPLAICGAGELTAHVNPAMASLLRIENGWTAEQPVAWQAMLAEGDWPEWCAAVHRARQSGQVQWLRTRLRSGVDHHAAMIQIVPLHAETDEPLSVGFAVLIRSAANDDSGQPYFHLRELLHLAEAEKWRFGQAMHDELGQRLSGMAFMAKSLERKLREARRPEADDAEWLTQLAKESISATRGLARGLVPVDVDEPAALVAALADLCQRSSTAFGADCSLESDPCFDPGGSAQANHLYHAAQELMTNAFKHGQAHKVVVRLEVHEHGQRLVVHNDGIALDPVALQARSGMGLSGIRSRVTYLGGGFTLRNQAQGTGVVATIELAIPSTTGRASSEP